MSIRSKGTLSGRTRNLSRHSKKSMINVSSIIKEFNIGDSVAIVPRTLKENIPHPRYKGKIGKIIEKRGSSYIVELKIMNATKKLIVLPIYLQGIKQQKK